MFLFHAVSTSVMFLLLYVYVIIDIKNQSKILRYLLAASASSLPAVANMVKWKYLVPFCQSS